MIETEVILYKGNCLEIMPTLQLNSIAMIFADLPYGVTKCEWDCKINLSDLWQAFQILYKKSCVVALTATQPFGSTLVNSNLKMFKYQMVWAKRFAANFAQARYRPLAEHEDVLIFGLGKNTYNPQMIKREKPIKSGGNKLRAKSAGDIKPHVDYKKKIYTHKHPGSILEFSCRADKRGFHPTQKPVALIEWLIRTYTNDGDTILDPVAGSGTTALAAMNVGNRKVICIEKDPTYFEVMSKRVAEHKEKLRQSSATP